MRIISICVVLLLTTLGAEAYEGRLVRGVWQQSWNDTLKASLKESGLLEHQENKSNCVCGNSL